MPGAHRGPVWDPGAHRGRVMRWWGMTGTRLPMFPLSGVLFPHASMPLHVFEPRYRSLMRDCLDADRRFGTVLIERGSEVGGGDERSALGTRCVITREIELPDGRWLLEVCGEALIEVVQWLPDDPYPVALVTEPAPVSGPEDLATVLELAVGLVRRARALLAEHGGTPALPPGLALDGGGDAEVAAWLLCAAAPVNAYDAAAALGGRRRGGTVAPAGGADGGSRTRPAPDARLGVSGRGRRQDRGGNHMAITPTREQFTEFAHGTRDGEVVMLNLLHFARPDETAGPSEGGASETTGAAAYRDYSEQVVQMVEARGGRVIWTGRPEHVLIGDPSTDAWDLVALVSYPSRAAFIDMVTSPSYESAHAHRERGLDRTVLLACEQVLFVPPRDEDADA